MAFNTRSDIIHKLLSSASEASSMPMGSDDDFEVQPMTRSSLVRQRFWTDGDQFFEDNLCEIYAKLPNLEKQIWGKLIVMETNRRTAKAYLRHPVVTVDGTDAEFDGLRIGLGRFVNTQRPAVVEEIFGEIQNGIKIKIDPDGNVWAKRMCHSPVYLKPLYRNRPNDLFVIDQRPVKVFDIQRFKEILVQELKQVQPDRKRLEKCCLICLKFAIDQPDLLLTPCWIVVVHLIAIELLNMVLPKDNEFSSPSSSFVAGLSPAGRASPSPTPSLEQSPPSSTSRHSPPTSRKLFIKGGVMKKIARSTEPFMPPPAAPPPPPPPPPPPLPPRRHSNFSSRSHIRYDHPGLLQPRTERRSITTSLIDLRQINKFQSPVYFERRTPNKRISRGGAGHDRCVPVRGVSMEHLDDSEGEPPNMPPEILRAIPAYASPQRALDSRQSLLMEAQLRQNIKRWKSQDSGIGSGGTFGSK